MTKSQLPVKQICFPSIISNFTSNRNWKENWKELWKTVSLTRFQKPQFIAILFNLLQVNRSVPAVIIAVLFIPSFNILSSYFYISLNFVVVCTVQILVNFVTQLRLKLLIKSFLFQDKVEGGLYQRWLIIRHFSFIGRWVYNCGEAYKWGGGGGA